MVNVYCLLLLAFCGCYLLIFLVFWLKLVLCYCYCSAAAAVVAAVVVFVKMYFSCVRRVCVCVQMGRLLDYDNALYSFLLPAATATIIAARSRVLIRTVRACVRSFVCVYLPLLNC